MPVEKSVKSKMPGSSLVHSFTLTDSEFEKIRVLVKQKTGISLSLQKRDLVVSRLARRLRNLKLTTFKQYINLIEKDPDGEELVHMINRITTNKTDFFRENHHFDFLTNTMLPALKHEKEMRGSKDITIWSAGCSSGEEPYTLAMTLLEFFGRASGWNLRILATDLDTTMLSKASLGEYDASLIGPVPKLLLNKYFDSKKDKETITYKVKPVIRNLVTYRKFNLMNASYPLKVAMDAIFCRNVLIYFDKDDKMDILTKFHGVLANGGYIFVGHSESLMMAKHLFRYVGTTIYHKV